MDQRHAGQGRGRGRRDAGRGRGRRDAGREAARTAAAPRAPPPPPPQTSSEVLTEANILKDGLAFVGFPGDRQNCRLSLKRDRFRAHYGVSPKSVQAVLKDLKDIGHEFPLKQFLMTLCWLRLYDTEHVMAGRWGLSEETIRNEVKVCISGIVSLKDQKIRWVEPAGTNIASVDGTHCRIFEPRRDPSSKWYSHKFHGPGLSYELAISLWSNNVLSVRGPFPASTHDITIFRFSREI